MNDSTRKKARVYVERPISLRTAKNKIPLLGTLIDISETGARVKCFDEILASQLNIDWCPVAGAPPLRLHGVIRWKANRMVGIHFEKLDPKTRLLLRALVEHHHRNS